MQKLHLWQEFDCPHGSDSDIEEPNLLHQGQKFYCHWCGGEHTAGVDVQVSTTRDWREYLDLPQSAEALKALTDQETAPSITEEELHALRKKVATYEARDALGWLPPSALATIEQALRDYHYALDSRQHGGVAADRALNTIAQTMGMHWKQGEEAARRAATKQGGA